MKKTITQKGITLIALIITIIILLILAVVTIGSIKNSNIISYAENASTNYETSKSEEKDILSQYEDLISVGLYKQTGPLGEARNIENYGKKVIGFQSKGEGLEDIVWRVFYQDDKNVYLISERVDSEGKKYYPIEKTKLYNTNNHKKADVLEKYNNGADVSIQGQELMKKAKEANIFTKENENENIIVTAYMCDIEAWKDYIDAEGNAAWAMGTPTIELYEKSFNSVKGESVITLNINESMGYRRPSVVADTITSERNEIYRLKGVIKEYGGGSAINVWYLASPGNSSIGMCGVYNANGNFAELSIVTASEDGVPSVLYAMRPIVCIPLDNFDYELE